MVHKDGVTMNHLYRLSAFPKTKYGGNKAGVYLYADGLSETQMQNIATKVGYSETAFVLKSQQADFKIRFFTPSSEVDLCGHATIATFSLLYLLNIINIGNYTQETKVGILKIRIENNLVWMQQKTPIFGNIVDKDEILNCFESICFNDKFKPQVISTGLKEIFVGVDNRNTLANLKPNYKKIEDLLNKTKTEGIHVFALDSQIDAYGRNFIPLLGIEEESATGTSNGALSCYLHRYHNKKQHYILRQGYEMNQPSEIRSKITYVNDRINDIWVGGSAYIIEK